MLWKFLEGGDIWFFNGVSNGIVSEVGGELGDIEIKGMKRFKKRWKGNSVKYREERFLLDLEIGNGWILMIVCFSGVRVGGKSKCWRLNGIEVMDIVSIDYFLKDYDWEGKESNRWWLSEVAGRGMCLCVYYVVFLLSLVFLDWRDIYYIYRLRRKWIERI